MSQMIYKSMILNIPKRYEVKQKRFRLRKDTSHTNERKKIPIYPSIEPSFDNGQNWLQFLLVI
jgi:hypothetical protein